MGIAVNVGGGKAKEWGVFNITRDTIIDDDTGEIKGYKLSADLYCGPSANAGGCNAGLFRLKTDDQSICGRSTGCVTGSCNEESL